MIQFKSILFLVFLILISACNPMVGSGTGLNMGTILGGGGSGFVGNDDSDLSGLTEADLGESDFYSDDSEIPQNPGVIALDEINLDDDVIELPLGNGFAENSNEDSLNSELIEDEIQSPEVFGDENWVENIDDDLPGDQQLEISNDEIGTDDQLAQIDVESEDLSETENFSTTESPTAPEGNSAIYDESNAEQDTEVDGTTPVDIVVSPPFNDENNGDETPQNGASCDEDGLILPILVQANDGINEDPEIMMASLGLSEEEMDELFDQGSAAVDDGHYWQLPGYTLQFKKCTTTIDDELVWVDLPLEVFTRDYDVSVVFNLGTKTTAIQKKDATNNLFIPKAILSDSFESALQIQKKVPTSSQFPVTQWSRF